ncbi:MAG TPA: hypothetical protein VMB24_04995, partial [Dehalococcoidales bacterium]|nr:hypothetical protein [Dehalococcoidales bacterium]
MFVIDNNITMRKQNVKRIFDQAKVSAWDTQSAAAHTLGEFAIKCVESGADSIQIDLQQHHDTPEAMQFAVSVIQKATSRQLCLSARNPETIEG